MRRTTDERKEQITHEALRIIHYRGYANLSIRELAKNVGISEAAIYRHFESKDAIMEGILEKLRRQFIELNSELDKISNPAERLYSFIIRMVQYLEQHNEMTAVLFNDEIFPPDSPAANSLLEIIKQRQNYIQSIIKAAQEQESIREDVPAEDLAMIVVGIMHKMVSEWRRLGFRFDMVSRIRELIHTLKVILS